VRVDELWKGWRCGRVLLGRACQPRRRLVDLCGQRRCQLGHRTSSRRSNCSERTRRAKVWQGLQSAWRKVKLVVATKTVRFKLLPAARRLTRGGRDGGGRAGSAEDACRDASACAQDAHSETVALPAEVTLLAGEEQPLRF